MDPRSSESMAPHPVCRPRRASGCLAQAAPASPQYPIQGSTQPSTPTSIFPMTHLGWGRRGVRVLGSPREGRRDTGQPGSRPSTLQARPAGASGHITHCPAGAVPWACAPRHLGRGRRQAFGVHLCAKDSACVTSRSLGTSPGQVRSPRAGSRHTAARAGARLRAGLAGPRACSVLIT